MVVIRTIGAFLFLLVVCFFAYWDIATFQDSLKWDMLDCYYPWRFFVGESIQNNVFPLWNPYQHLGYPIYADMRSVFYPETFIVGLLGGYDLKVLHGLFIFYIVLAGTGMYRLCGWFAKSEMTKLTISIAYVLSGYFVGHGQELGGIIAATWIPWVLYYFLRFQQNLQWADLWKLSFFLFLQITGAYQALSLILAYLLITLFVIGLIRNSRSPTGVPIIKILAKNLVLGTVVLLSLSVLILAYVQVSPHVERLTGLSLQDAYTGLLTPQAMLSFLAPFSVAGDAKFLGTNVTMANVYVGIIVLGLAIAGLFQQRKWTLTVIVFFGLFSLLASLGPHTPVREFLYNHVPGLNLFRMSSFFSYFSQLALFLLAALGLDKLIDNPSAIFRNVRNALGLVLLALVAVLIISWFDKSGEAHTTFHGLSSLLDLKYHQRLFFHCLLQVGFVLLGLVLITVLKKNRRAVSVTMLLLVLIEMFVSVQLNFQGTIGGGSDPRKIQGRLNHEPVGFPFPSMKIPLADNIESKPRLNPLFHNTNILSKSVSWDGFNSFRLDRFELFKKYHQEAYLEGLKEPLVFSTSTQTEIELTGFSPSQTECKVNVQESCVVVLQQTYFPGWNTWVDDKPVSQLLWNGIYPSVKLEPGQYDVRFRYENKPIILAFYVSYGLFVLLIGLCLFYVFRTANNSQRSLVLAVGLMLVGILFFGFKWMNLETMEEKRLRSYRVLSNMIGQEAYPATEIYLHLDMPMLMDSLLNANGVKNNVNYLHGLQCDDHSRLIEKVSRSSAEHLIYAGSNLPEDRTIMEVIQEHFPSRTTERIGREYVHIFKKTGERETLYSSTNDFEKANATWYFEEHQKDTSTKAFSGNYGWSISPSQMGSPPIILRAGDITSNSQLKFVFRSKVFIPEGDRNRAGMFIQVERDRAQYWHRAQEINNCSSTTNKWFETILIAEPDFDVLPDDVLKVFVWGTDKGEPIYLDDMSFSIYPQD